MAQPVVTRSQRRIEKKQLALITILILAVAGVSFSLGVLYGTRAGSSNLDAENQNTKLPAVTKVVPPPPPLPVAEVEKPEQLTFYDNLPKGNQAPLGSGINLPPQQTKIVNVETKHDVPKVAIPPKVLAPEPVKVPVASANGTFVVQVASFRTGTDAKKMADNLKKHHLSTFVESADLGEKGVWHRVLAGPYASREQADQAVGLLREKERLSALVRQR